MATAEYEQAVQVVETLTRTEQERLARRLLHLNRPPRAGERVSIMELKGLGKELWRGIDSDAYLQAERDSWDR